MSREAAERLVAAFDHPLSERRNLRHDDIEAVARAYLALLTPGEDDERIAREIVVRWSEDHSDAYSPQYTDEQEAALTRLVAQALAARGARQRGADMKALCFGCAHGWDVMPIESPITKHTIWMHRAEGCEKFGHRCYAAAIRSGKD